jgi:replication-associated recombination protein RarA
MGMLITPGLIEAFPTFNDLPLNQSNQNAISTFRMVAAGRPQNILLHGSYGTGKTTLAELLVRWSYGSQGNDTLGPYFIDCSAGLDLDHLQAPQTNWANFYGVKEEWYVLDEVARLRSKDMQALIGIIKPYPCPRHFILTANDLSKVDRALHSRCELLEIIAPTAPEYLGYAQKRLRAEGVTLADADVLKYLEAGMTGDLRDTERKLDKIIWKYKGPQPGPIIVPASMPVSTPPASP